MNDLRNEHPNGVRPSAGAADRASLRSIIDHACIDASTGSIGPAYGSTDWAADRHLPTMTFVRPNAAAGIVRRREATVAVIERNASGLGTKAVERALLEGWTADHFERYGPMPKARTARRWCSIARAGMPLSNRGYMRRRKPDSRSKPVSDEGSDACRVPHDRPPVPESFLYVDGMSVTAMVTPSAEPFHRSSGDGTAGRGSGQGRTPAADESEPRRIVAKGAGSLPEKADGRHTTFRSAPTVVDDLIGGPPWRRRRRRLFPPVDGDPAIGASVRIGDRVRRFLGRTGNGRMAFADAPISGTVQRPTVRTFPATVTMVRLGRSSEA